VPARYQRRRPDPGILARAPARRPWSTEAKARIAAKSLVLGADLRLVD
jgi:hypothetical protein